MSFPPPYDPTDQVAEFHLAALPASVPWARRHARQQLREWRLEDFTDDLLLAVSEIVTNSVKETGAQEVLPSDGELHDENLAAVRLRLRLTTSGLYAEVWDSADKSPVPRQASIFDEGGRGLALVAALCDDWGFYSSRIGGKVTWCVIKAPPSPPNLVTSPGDKPDPTTPFDWPVADAETRHQVIEGQSEVRNARREPGALAPFEPEDDLLGTVMC